MTKLTESDIEQMTLELLEGKGYEYLYGPDIAPEGENRFRITVTVAVSPQFLGWIIALGEGVKIIGPEEVIAQMQQEARRLAEQYL